MTIMQACLQYCHDKLIVSDLTVLLATAPSGRDSNIYSGSALQGAPLAYVVYKYVSTSQSMTNGNVLVASDMIFEIKGVIDGRDDIAAQAIALQIEICMDKASSSSIGGYIINSYRTGEIPSTVVFEGKEYRQAGGRYRIIVRPQL